MSLIGPFDTEAEAIAECSGSTSESSTDTDIEYCGCHDVPETLTVTVTSDCDFANGSFTVTHHPAGGYQWDKTGPLETGITHVGLGALCGWSISVWCGTPEAGYAFALGFLHVESCTPFVAVGTGGTVLTGKPGCCVGQAITVTVTA